MPSIGLYLKGMRGRILFFASLVGFVYLLSRGSEHLEQKRTMSVMASVDEWRAKPGVMEGLRNFWMDLAHDLAITKPSNPVPKHGPPTEAMKKSSDGYATLYTIEMSTEDIAAMKTAHTTFVERTSSLSLVDLYIPGSRGIVTTAGGKYIPVFLVSLRLLRRTGSTLPVEVFLADQTEYDHKLCTRTLPALNARCRILTDVLGASENVEIKTYQYKIFAILFSSFEDVFFLDADNLPLLDPAQLLISEPFSTYGMVSRRLEVLFELQGKEPLHKIH